MNKMIKNGKFLQCTYCQKQALPNTEPPVCEEHNKLRKKASHPKTLKELDSVDRSSTGGSSPMAGSDTV